jgi:hypothetical protein
VQEALKRRRLALLPAVAAAMLFAQAAPAQQLNPRKGAPPSSESKKSRLVARAELQAQEDGSSLKSDDLTVTRSCGNVQIGGASATAGKPDKTLVGSQPGLHQENSTVVRNVVNICR